MSRKAKRKSGEPPGRSETGPDTGKKPTTWALVLGVFLVFVTLIALQATLREIYIGMHRADYVRDELVVSSMTNPHDEPRLHGEIASSGESVFVPVDVAGSGGLDRFRELKREGRVKGQRIPVWYLQQPTPWWVTGSNPVRLIPVSHLEDHNGGWRTGVAITVILAIVTVGLLVYGVKRIAWSQEPAS